MSGTSRLHEYCSDGGLCSCISETLKSSAAPLNSLRTHTLDIKIDGKESGSGEDGIRTVFLGERPQIAPAGGRVVRVDTEASAGS